MARVNSPLALGMTSRWLMALEPAEWPYRVTFSGSPVNAEICRWVQRSASTRSKRARLLLKRYSSWLVREDKFKLPNTPTR